MSQISQNTAVSLEIPTQVAEKSLVAHARRLFLTLFFKKNHVGKRLTNSHQEFKRDAQVRDNGQFSTWRTSCTAAGNNFVSDWPFVCLP